MTRVRKIGPSVALPPPRQRVRRGGAARILRGTDGRPVRARRLAEPASLRLRLLRFSSVVLVFTFFAALWTRPVRHVEIQGVWLSSPDYVTSLLEAEVGRRWVTTPTRDLEAQLRHDPWIDDAQVLRAPGARILVKIREAEPAFSTLWNDARRVVDRRGKILPSADGLIVEELPVLAGLDIENGEFTEASREAFLAVVHALDASGWLWSEGLARVDLSDRDEVILRSSDEVEVIIRLDGAREQLAAAAAVWHRLDASGPTRVDLRFEDQIVLSH